MKPSEELILQAACLILIEKGEQEAAEHLQYTTHTLKQKEIVESTNNQTKDKE